MAVEEFLGGGNPHRLYRIVGAQGAWETPLTYGPLLWMPYVVPYVLQFDLRIFSLVGQLVVPAAAAIASAIAARRGRWVRASILAVMSVALLWNTQYRAFFPIGHTQIYWPLLLVFAILLAQERWTAACVVAGLLCAARTTMVSIVPVLLIALYVKRELSWRRVALVAIGAIGPFVPFLLTAPKMVLDGVYGSYMEPIKGFVWTHTSWAVTTFGVTRWLLRNGLQYYLEAVQAAVMIGTYALAYFGLRRGHAPLPWMASALLAFSMTAMWPVLYIYLDVWTLVVAGLAATVLAHTRAPSWRAVAIPGALVIATFAVVLTAGAHVRGASYVIDIGTPDSVGMTGAGFGTDQSERDGDHTFVWVEGPMARTRVPRAGLTSTQIHVRLQPFAPVSGLKQTVTALLNDHPIGEVTLTDDWQDVAFDAPRSVWLYGFNVLTLEFGYATSAWQTGTGTDTRQLSAAVARVWIASP
jgi:hypothetical protein